MGFFSWKTQDTNRSICNRYSNRKTFTVYMVNPITGKSYKEDNYEGYGEFGGKDYYELVAELNGRKTRSEGIDLAFSQTRETYIYPILVENKKEWRKYIGQDPINCNSQGYFYE